MSSSSSSKLLAAIDIGTNSFKLIIIQPHPNNTTFLTIDHLRHPLHLTSDVSPTSSSSYTLSPQSHLAALETLLQFQTKLTSHGVSKARVSCVATAAVRGAENKEGFVRFVKERGGFDVDVLCGEEEARLVYKGMLQFWPGLNGRLVLGVDIGGGSTEVVIGKEGSVVFAASLKLGHVSLARRFGSNVGEIREYVRLVVEESGVVRKIKGCGFEVVVGSSGTIKAVEKAVFSGILNKSNVGCVEDGRKDWRLSRGEVKGVVASLCGGGDREGIRRREKYFGRRAEFIVAGAVLLEEIFDGFGIEEMEVSGYALAEGVIAERLAEGNGGYHLTANVRWSSVVRLAMRYNGTKRMKAAAQCAITARVR